MSMRFGEFAFAVQSAYGTPASAPLWALPLGMPEGSGVPMPEVEWDPRPAARGSVGLQEVRRNVVSWLSDISVPAFTSATAILLKGLLGAETVTGTFRSVVPATPDTWFTFWSKRPGAAYERYTDGIIEGLRFDFTSGEPINLGIQARGREPEFLGAAYSPTNQADVRSNWLTYIGADLRFDWSGTTATTVRWETESGQLYISRPANVIPSYRNVKPTAITRGGLSVELPLQLVFRDIEHYRQSVYGGLVTVPQRATVYGAATLKFYEPNQTGNRYLFVNLPAVSWDVGPPQPLSHPEEGSVLVDVTGKAVVPAVIGRTGAMIRIDVETGVVGVTTKVASDSAVFIDTSSLITPTAKNVSDIGTAAETRSLTATVAVTDAASGADASTLLAAGVVNVSDSGVASETSGVGKTVSDSAVGSETTDMGKTVTDVGTGFDTSALTTPISVSDTGSAAEVSSVATGVVVSDTGVGADASALAAALTRSDAGSASDTSGLQLPGLLGQLHFRIRSDDTQLLNADAGWAAALDTNATIPAERIFRIRFELVDVGTVTPKLQYRRNGGAWTDVAGRAVAEPTQSGTDECEGVLSVQYANGDTTTNVLAGSAAGFVAGDGVEGAAAPSSANTTGAHSEFEWAVRMRKLWHNGTTRGCNVQGDTFEFRVVPATGGILPGNYVNPTVTLDCTRRIGGVLVESLHRGGPFRDTNGNLYVFVEYGEPSNISDESTMMKSTDGGLQWDRVDPNGAPPKTLNTSYDFEALDIHQVGPTLHIAAHSKNNRYSTFLTSDHPTDPDTWDVRAEVVKDNSVQPNDQEATLAVRSNGSIVYAYAKEPSGAFEQAAYKIRSAAGVWGSEINLDTTASTSFRGVDAVLGAGDLVYIFYKDDTNDHVFYKTLNTSDVLSARTQLDPTGTVPQQKPINAARYFDDAGVETIVAMYRRSSNLMERRIRGGVLQTERVVSDVNIASNRAGSLMPAAHTAVDPASKTIFGVYIDSANFDLFYDKSVAGGAYGTDVAIQTGDFYEITSEYGNGVLMIAVDDQAGGYTGGVIFIGVAVGGAVTVNVTDSCTVSDSSSVIGPVLKNVTDAVAGSDASATTAALPISDSGSAGEASSVIGPTNKDVSDSGSVGDASATTALLTASDSGSASDSSGVTTGVIPTLTLIDSFQHRVLPGNITAVAGFWYSNATNAGTLPNHGGGGLTFDTSIKRTASHVCSLKIAADNVTPTAVRRTIAQPVVVGSIYFRADSAPTTGVNIVSCDPPVSSVIRAQLLPDGHVQLKVTGGTTTQSSGTYIDSAWHRLDYKIDTSTTTGTMDAIVDGTDTITQATGTVTSGNMTAAHCGDKNASGPGTIYLSDFVASFTAGDYPIGAHTCKLLAIDGSGTHAQGSGAFQTMPGAGTTNYHTFVDDAWDGTTPELSQTGEDYVRQTVVDTSGYLEFTVADPAGGDTIIWGAQLGVLMAAEDSTTGDTCECRLVDSAGSTLATTGALTDPSINAAYHSGYRAPTTASPSGGWSNSSLAAVKIRWGFSNDVTPNPIMNAAIVEYVVGA